MMGRFVARAPARQRVRPDFEDGLRCQVLTEAWERAHEASTWVEVPRMPQPGAGI